MGAWLYILRCADGSYYTGTTRADLEQRIAEHQAGAFPGYTTTRRPVEILYSEFFDRIVDAVAAERQVKGWSRAKKEALMAGNFQRIAQFVATSHVIPGPWFETRRCATLLTMRSRDDAAASRPAAPNNKVRVARIGAAHGVRGEMKLWSFTGDPAAVADYGAAGNRRRQTAFEIETMRAAKDHFVVRIAGHRRPRCGGRLVNTDLFVPRDRLPAIDEDDTYYHADLIGLAAVTPEGVALGTVTALHNFGAGDLIEIATTQGGEPLLLPFNETIVPEIDIAAKKIVVVLPSVTE